MLNTVQNPSIIPLSPAWFIGIPRSWSIIIPNIQRVVQYTKILYHQPTGVLNIAQMSPWKYDFEDVFFNQRWWFHISIPSVFSEHQLFWQGSTTIEQATIDFWSSSRIGKYNGGLCPILSSLDTVLWMEEFLAFQHQLMTISNHDKSWDCNGIDRLPYLVQEFYCRNYKMITAYPNPEHQALSARVRVFGTRFSLKAWEFHEILQPSTSEARKLPLILRLLPRCWESRCSFQARN